MTTLAAIVALGGVGIALVALVLLHLMRTGLDPVRSAVSAYGISRRRLLYRIATIALGIAALLLGVSVNAFLAAPNLLAFVFLLVFGVVQLVISWAPMDAPGSPRTGTGRAHVVLAALFYASAIAAVFLFTGSFAGDAVFGPVEPVSLALAWSMAVLAVAVVVCAAAPALRRVFGLADRLLYAALVGWLVVVAAAVLMR